MYLSIYIYLSIPLSLTGIETVLAQCFINLTRFAQENQLGLAGCLPAAAPLASMRLRPVSSDSEEKEDMLGAVRR